VSIPGPSIDASRSLTGRAFRGLTWQLLGRGGEQALRLVANLLLARLLSPDDFGVVGMAAAGLAIADALAFVGTEQAVLADRHGRRPRFVATAWSLALIRSIILGVVLLALAAPLARWYEQPAATPIFMMIALQPLLLGLAHPGAYVPLRGLAFGPWTIARLVAAAVGVLISVVLAIQLRSAWALVIGQLTTTAIASLASHAITPRRIWVRPALDRKHLRRLLAFSAGALGTPILIIAVTQAPAILVGPTLGPAVLGVFLLHRRLCDTGQQLAVQAAGSVIVPASAELACDHRRLARAWCRTLRTAGLVALPAAALLAWMGADLPDVLLGSQYRGAAGQFSALAIAGGCSTILGVAGPFFWGLKRPGDDRIIQFIRTATLAALAIPMLSSFGGTGLAIALALSSAGGVLAAAGLMRRRIGIGVRTTLSTLAPGVLTGAAVWTAGIALDTALAPRPLVRLAVGGIASALAVAIWLLPRLVRRLQLAPDQRAAPAPGAPA
jgi:O-antigen/teichoic acid export membrane protein